ncbi:hypothetical protein [Klebsiella quasipneumoniae]|nr:hypothetical protein [Klebsiella quasipneumoniae]
MAGGQPLAGWRAGGLAGWRAGGLAGWSAEPGTAAARTFAHL